MKRSCWASVPLMMSVACKVLLKDGDGARLIFFRSACRSEDRICGRGLQVGRPALGQRLCRNDPVVPTGMEKFAVAARAVLYRLGDTGDRGGAHAGLGRYVAVAHAGDEQTGHFQALAPILQFPKRSQVAKQIGYVLLAPAREETFAEGLEPRLAPVGIISEALLGGHGCTVRDEGRCVNVLPQ